MDIPIVLSSVDAESVLCEFQKPKAPYRAPAPARVEVMLKANGTFAVGRYVGRQGEGHHNQPKSLEHDDEHAPGSVLLAVTTTSTDGPRTILIAEADHHEYVPDAASDHIVKDLNAFYVGSARRF